jgi:tRNA(Ile)-lysidine synthase
MIRMQLLRKKVLRFIRELNLLTPGETVVVAFSGGADSTALLDILANLPGFPLNLVAAHLNHMLRSEESDGDELFVSSAASRYGIRVETSRLDVAALGREKRLSLEEAGREARYGFFREIAIKHSASAIALGHHKDDQAETVLMRLVRGAGGSGLSGMRPRSGNIVRPLLQLSRDEIEAYLHKAGVIWREDGSNSDTRFMRNRIRHELLPLLETFNPEIVQALNQSAEALAADEEVLEGLTSQSLARTALSGCSSVRFDLSKLFLEPAPLRKRLYRAAVSSVKGDLKRISFIHLTDIERLVLSGKPNGELNLPVGIRVVRDYGSLIFTALEDDSFSDLDELSIAACGNYNLPCGGLISVGQSGDSDVKGRGIIFIDPDELPFPWTVRYFRKGDRFRSLGLDGSKKLKDLFVDRKIPLRERARNPLLVCRDEIIWVCGVQSAERTRAAAGGRELKMLRITYTPASIRH